MVSRLSASTLARWIAVLAALVMVVTTAAAGVGYVFCARTGTTHARPCCPQHRVHAKNRQPLPPRILNARSCCESRSLPDSSVPALESSSGASLASSAALVQDAWALQPRSGAGRPLFRQRWPIRAGPIEATERRARLQVYLI